MDALRLTMAAAGTALLATAASVYRSDGTRALRPFAALVGVVGTLAVADSLAAGDPTGLSVVWLVAYLAIPVAFGWFVVEYYGLPHLASRARRVAFATPVALGVAGGTVAILAPSTAGAMNGGGITGTPRFPAVVALATTFEQAGLYFASAVMLGGIALLAVTVARYEHLDRRLAVALSFVPAWPWVGHFLTPGMSGTVPAETLVGFTTVGYVLSAGAAAFAVTRGGLDDAAPAAGTLGPRTVLSELDEPVFVVDRRGRVVRANETAVETFGGGSEPVGARLAAVVGVDRATLAEPGAVTLDVDGRTRRFEATVSAVTDRYGRSPGEAVVLRDVTGERVRGQRLSVLNRVVRHNLRNELSTIIGRASIIAERDGDHTDMAESILDTADDLADLGDRAHEVEEMMARSLNTDPSLAVGPVAERVVDGYCATDPTATLSVDAPDSLTVAADETLLSQVLDNLVENAVEHNDAPTPVVTVSARAVPNERAVRISVADNGAGLPDHERAAIESGEESPLEHGSGLGLWAVNWGVTRLGGRLAFDDRDPIGTVVTVTLPAGAEADTAPTASAPAD
ncbi:hypothetical protein I7X12_05200 [Halosimplex litoreum]|uniref:histidine kinase n=1 Tax=Halosimplex litoreum TaxID=1198301 RepID=A0A7T3G0L2_9EURY|nr:sensor histidine kinase [Halosimplex litoreum]QPV64027.1 hypothetical protein I7X12_05200 [Halosimplex litoreum]